MYSASERVEFFQSESEFESESSLNNSRYYDFTNEIISETDNIYLSLKRQLLPNETLLEEDKIRYVMNRAQLIYKDTITEHLSYLRKIEAPSGVIGQVENCSEKLGKLLKDYENLRNNTMIYKQFFNLYGRENMVGGNENNFQKGERILRIDDSQDAVLQPECIQINYSTRNKLKATPRVFMAASPGTNDKEVSSLREEIHMLKKNIEEMKKNHNVELTNERLNAEKRIRTYLRANVAKQENLSRQVPNPIEDYSLKLSSVEEENLTMRRQLEEKDRQIFILKEMNSQKESDNALLRGRDINMEEENVHDKSYNTDLNDKEDKKAEKKLKIALYENEILKRQLKTEREKVFRNTSNLTEEERRELDRLRKEVERRRTQYEKLQEDFDRQRIEVAQLTHNYKMASKMNEEVKDQNEQMKKKFKLMTKQPNLMSLSSAELPQRMEMSEVDQSKKLSVSGYEGQGIQGLPYYDILSKEFKIRFRRACLKEKELLHKSNGLQIGVITNFEKPNKLKLLVHLTNYGDIDFKRLKGKILNANENKIVGELFQYQEINQNQQIKVPLQVIVSHYPLGPLILLLEYQSDKREELRVLLPSHIFKMMEFQELREPIKNGQGISITTQRKIMKNVEDFKQYVKGIEVIDNSLRFSVYHRHTHTELHLQLTQTREGTDLIYRHFQGNSHISEYFVKTLAFLLRK